MSDTPNYLEMSDEDFSNQLPPEIVEPELESEQIPEKDPDEPEVIPENNLENEGEDKEVKEDTPEVTPVEPEVKPEDTPASAEDTPASDEFDYVNFHKEITGEFKAAGGQFVVKDAKEARQLMQKGIDYTRKMQAMAPHRKMLMTLERAGLADEDKINYLIELAQGNPQAIHKLIHESGIDPLAIDTTTKPEYQAGNHFVSDQAVDLQTVLDDYNTSPEGQETLSTIFAWDQASKGEIAKNPSDIHIIHLHKQNGVFQKVSNEVHRMQVLGQIPPNTPFITAYKHVGTEMEKQGLLADETQTAPAVPKAAPIETRVVKPAAVVQNNERAESAAPSSGSGKPAETFVNPLAMDDKAFEKQWEAYKQTMQS